MMPRRPRSRSATNRRQPNPLLAPMTPKTVGKAMAAATRLEYDPLSRQLGSEARASRQRSQQITKIYKGLTQMANNQAGQAAADYAAQNQRYKGYLGIVGAQDSANTAAINAQDASLAAITGATPNTQAAQTEAASQAMRGLAAANFGGLVQAQGANQRSYLRNAARIAKHEGIGQRIQEGANLRTIHDDQRTLAKDRGDYRAKYMADARNTAWDRHIQNMAFTTPSQYDKTVRAQTAAGVKQAQINANATKYQANAGITKEQTHSQGLKNLPTYGGKKDDPSGITNQRTAAGYLRQGVPQGGYKSQAQAIDSLINRGVNPATAKQVVKQAYAKNSKGGQGGQNFIDKFHIW